MRQVRNEALAPSFTQPFLAVIALGLPLALLAVVTRDLRRFWLAFRSMQLGRYREAREIQERIGRSWLALLPAVRHGMRYSVALTHHFEGDFARTLAVLATIPRDRIDETLKSAVSALEATTLVLEERDAARVATMLERANAPEDLLVLAHAKHALGDVDAASKLLAKVGIERDATTPRATHQAIFHTLRGLLLVKLGRNDEAVVAFRRAADMPLQNWYTERARSLLPRPGEDGEGRSSLAPQVIE